MKRLILMGGRPWFDANKGKRFTETLFRYFPKEANVAFCIFAQDEREWDETLKWNADMLNSYKGQRSIFYRTMTLDDFTEVPDWSEVIYVPCGDHVLLLQQLARSGDNEKL